jgi:hypothetical protein
MSKFIKSVASNDNGVGSSNRISLMVIVAALIIWSTVVVWRTGAIPEISESWIYLVGIFVGGTATGKATDAYGKKKAKPEEPKEE